MVLGENTSAAPSEKISVGGIPNSRMFNTSFLRKCIHSPHSIASQALCQPQDGKNLVPQVFCSSWSRNLQNPIETRNLRNLRNRAFPNLGNAISGTWNLRKTSPIENRNQFPEPVPRMSEPIETWNHFRKPGTSFNPSKPGTGPSSSRTHRNLYCAKTP